jgi:hypothetical protein
VVARRVVFIVHGSFSSVKTALAAGPRQFVVASGYG